MVAERQLDRLGREDPCAVQGAVGQEHGDEAPVVATGAVGAVARGGELGGGGEVVRGGREAAVRLALVHGHEPRPLLVARLEGRVVPGSKTSGAVRHARFPENGCGWPVTSW
jgi:hypothetical protein